MYYLISSVELYMIKMSLLKLFKLITPGVSVLPEIDPGSSLWVPGQEASDFSL